MVVSVAILSIKYSLELKADLIDQSFQFEQSRLAMFDSDVDALSEQLISAASVIAEYYSNKPEDDSFLEFDQTNLEMDMLGFRLTEVPLLAPNKKQNLSTVFDPNVHYLLYDYDSYLPILDMVQRNELAKKVLFIADVDDHKFQVLSFDEEDTPLPLLDWLEQNRDSWLNLSDVSELIFAPPYVYRGEHVNYLLISLPVTNLKPIYIAVELNLANLYLTDNDDTKFVIWQSENQRVITSNIDVSQDYSTNIQSLLATRYIPSAWHNFTLKSYDYTPSKQNLSESDVSYQSESLDGPQKRLIENDVSEGIKWLTYKGQMKSAPFDVFMYSEATQLAKELQNGALSFTLQILLLGVACLVIFNVVVFKLLLKPFSMLISYIERQNSLYELEDIAPPSGWEPWFEKIKKSFTDNRKLFNSLVAKNKELDDKVQERTRALHLQTMQKDRNLALNRAIINSMPDLIYYKNIDGSFVGCNRAFEKFTGVKEAQLVTNLVEDVFDSAVADELSKFDFQALKGKRLFSAKVWHQVPNGGDVYINWLVTPVVNVEGDLLGTVSLGRDITEQETSFRQVEQARIAAESADTAKSEFIANMSHEIRTPMHAILGMIELLNSASPSPIQQSYLAVAESSSRHMLKVINDILDFSKVDAGKLELALEPVDLSEVLDIAFANSLSDAMQKELMLDIDLPLDFPNTLITDKIRLSQIFTNLINNAVKFTDKGTVRVSGSVLAVKRNEYTVSFEVQDTGKGIAKEQQQKVFDAFAQADASTTRQYGGTGLGLAIVFQLVELMGGEIHLDSELGKGTTITITVTLKGHITNRLSLKHIYQWLVYDPKTSQLDFVAQKLRTAKQVVTTTDRPIEIDTSKFDVLVCRPELLETLDKGLIDKINAGQIDYQPVVFNISQFSSELLDSVRFRPLLSAPFSNWDLVKNSETKSTEVKKEERIDHANLLVVDDNYVNQQVMRLMLESSGANVTIAENGLVALRQLRQNDFDTVLLDIQMPVMDGLTCARKIRESDDIKDIPVIAMTAHSSKEDYERSLEAGIDVHLEKPIDKTKLLSVINSFLNKSDINPEILSLAPVFESVEDVDQVAESKDETSISDLPVINREQLIAQFGNNESTMNKLLVIFLKSKQQELKMFGGHLSEPANNETYAKLHNIQGMLANIRAEKAVEATKRLREALKKGHELEKNRAIALWSEVTNELFVYLKRFD